MAVPEIGKWESYCRMTCRGGSERGRCSCSCPNACQLQNEPDFERQLTIAANRLLKGTLS